MNVTRDYYLNKLKNHIQDGFVKVITGVRRCGDFFRKVIVTSGYAEPRVGKDGIVTVGVLPFLLDEKIYQSIVS